MTGKEEVIRKAEEYTFHARPYDHNAAGIRRRGLLLPQQRRQTACSAAGTGAGKGFQSACRWIFSGQPTWA